MSYLLHDLEQVLEPELHLTLRAALSRATGSAIWAGRPWQVCDPDGEPAYSYRYPKDTI